MSCPPAHVAVGEDCTPTPSCPDGRIAITTGQCCWPGQSWDETGQRCHGRPASCPSGRAVRGTDCAPTLEAAGGRVQSILSGLAYRFETRGDAGTGVTTTTGHYELDAPACALRFADVQDLTASTDPTSHTEVRRTLLLRLNVAARVAGQSAGSDGGAVVVTAPGAIESGGHRSLVTAQTLPVGAHRDELIDALADLARACGAHPHVSH